MGEPQRAEIQKLFHSDALTILNVVWAPGMMVMPHNHRMRLKHYALIEERRFAWRLVSAEKSVLTPDGVAHCQ